MIYRAALTLFLSLFVLSHAATDGGFDHRSHSVPGSDKLVYDVDDNGSELVTLDGSGSHSHYFDAGPPIVTGEIVTYSWVNTKNNQVVCTTKICNLSFGIGETVLRLDVTDNTGDSAQDVIKIMVRPKTEATSPPRIDTSAPISQ